MPDDTEPVTIIDSCDVRDWIAVVLEWAIRFLCIMLGAAIVLHLWRRHERIVRKNRWEATFPAAAPIPERQPEGPAHAGEAEVGS